MTWGTLSSGRPDHGGMQDLRRENSIWHHCFSWLFFFSFSRKEAHTAYQGWVTILTYSAYTRRLEILIWGVLVALHLLNLS